MKRIPITPEIKAQLQAALGPDVDVTDDYAVFESISLNNLPLPGKRGQLFERAVTSPTTLLAMVNHINAEGGSLPLMIDHNMAGAPKGRIFHAGLNLDDNAVELRTLFYIDPTEPEIAAKVDNGTYDEVSVQFLAEKILCSECEFDYRGSDASWSHLLELTCDNDHHIGENGVHVRLLGLDQFVELSLVARGAADKPKIIGKSASKLAPATTQRLAAQGFENSDALICRASLGEDTVTVDVNKLITDLSDARGNVIARDNQITTLTASVETANAQITTLTAERDTALTAQATAETALSDANANSGAADRDAAITYLSSILSKVRVAAGKTEGDLPKDVAGLTAAIDTETSQLTAILPVGGVTVKAGDAPKDDVARDFSAFKTSK